MPYRNCEHDGTQTQATQTQATVAFQRKERNKTNKENELKRYRKIISTLFLYVKPCLVVCRVAFFRF